MEQPESLFEPRARKGPTVGTLIAAGLVVAGLVVASAPAALRAGAGEAPGPVASQGGWAVYREGSLLLAWRPGLSGAGASSAPLLDVLATLGPSLGQARDLLGLSSRDRSAPSPLPHPSPPSPSFSPSSPPTLTPVVVLGPAPGEAAWPWPTPPPPGPLVGVRPRTLREDLALAAAEIALREALGGGRPAGAVTAGLGALLELGEARVAAAALALEERDRLASLAQLGRWWPALPLGAEQLGSVTAFVLDRGGGGPALVRLAGIWPGFVGWPDDLDDACRATLGVDTAQADRAWVEWVRSRERVLAPAVLEAERERVGQDLGRARAGMLGACAAGIAAVAAVVLALLSAGRTALVWVLLPFTLAAALELWAFTGLADPWVKSAVAFGEVLVMAGVVTLWRRAGRVAAAHEGRPAGSPPGPRGRLAWLGLGVALSVLIFIPRLGLYWYAREIWAKAPMIVLVLALVYGLERSDSASVGLGPQPPARLFRACFVGLFAFRLVVLLAELTAKSLLAGPVTGMEWLWHDYSPWWRAAGFHHWPAAPWGAGRVAQDVWDYCFGNFAEELFFRGYLYTRLKGPLGRGPALLVQALLFGLFHVNYDLLPLDPWPMAFYILMSGAFGLMMGLLLDATGSLVVPAVVHPAFNLGVFCLVVVSERGLGWTGYLLFYALEIAFGLLLLPRLVRAGLGTPRRVPAAPAMGAGQRA
ncbi:MAG: CPBP family intramembrane metalloprotease [Firmicutes bacterium]|nr:CPBP family intramembrane metalloprotease [Bacillota bacterium]